MAQFVECVSWFDRSQDPTPRASPTQVGGCVDLTAIANNFASYFSEVYAPNSRHRASSLYNEYISLRENYFGLPLAADLAFDTELVSKITL